MEEYPSRTDLPRWAVHSYRGQRKEANDARLSARGDGSIHCLASADEVTNFFQTVADSYAREGSGGKATRSNLRVIPLGGRSALATMDWEMLRADGSAIRGWQQSYNLVRGQAGWQILVSTFHVAAEQRAA